MGHCYRFLAMLFSIVVILPATGAAQSTIPPATQGLLNVLNAARTAPMSDLVAWAQGAPGSAAVATIATEINALAPPDRDAMMYWLDAHGRGPLHARGATDAQIGVPYFPIDYTVTAAQWPASVAPLVIPTPVPAPTATPQPRRHSSFGLLGALLPDLQIPIASSSSSSSQTTTTNLPGGTETNTTTQSSGTSVSVGVNPWAIVGSLIDASSAQNASPSSPSVPWRGLLFAASTLGTEGSPVVVTRGFAAVRNDGTEGLACVSFANNAQKIASEVDVDIEILNTLGFIRRVAPLRLTGSFVPGQEIGGPANVEAVDSARANCVIDGENTLADLTDPFSGAQAVVYSIRRVLFADGTQWLQPGANPWN